MPATFGFRSALSAHLQNESSAHDAQSLAAQIRAFLESHKNDLDSVRAIDQTPSPAKLSARTLVTTVQIETSRFLNEIEAVWLMSNMIALLNENLAQFAGVKRFRDDVAPPIERAT